MGMHFLDSHQFLKALVALNPGTIELRHAAESNAIQDVMEFIKMVAQSPDTPVLIMTSYASLRSAIDSMKMGAVDYIAKPFAADVLIKKMKSLLS